MVKTVIGDIFNGPEKVIAHQTNCMGVMGATGKVNNFASQVRAKYPEVYKKYKELCSAHTPDYLIGNIQLVDTHDGKLVANLFGQRGYGTDKQYTDYKELRSAFIYLAEEMKALKWSIAMPVGIGCGRGGGDWNIVLPMIEEIFADCDVTLYKLP